MFGSRWELAIQLLIPLLAALVLLILWFVVPQRAIVRERSSRRHDES